MAALDLIVEQLDGFALCTDDNLRTVYHVANASKSGRRFWHEPVEWALVSKKAKPEFWRISETLNAMANEAIEQGRFSGHISECFDAMVTSIELNAPDLDKRTGLLKLVISTDPSAKLGKFEVAAARRLNAGPVFAEWERARG